MIPALYALHVIFVLLWIGGVAFVTLVVFPILMKMDDSLEQVLLFHRIEGKFALQAKFYVWLSGISGWLLLYYTGMYTSLFTADTLGISIMIVVWVLYLLILSFEKTIFGAIFNKPEKMESKKVFRFMTVFHWVVLGLSLLAVFAGVWQGHGGGL